MGRSKVIPLFDHQDPAFMQLLRAVGARPYRSCQGRACAVPARVHVGLQVR